MPRSNLFDAQAHYNHHCMVLSPRQGAFPNNLHGDWRMGYTHLAQATLRNRNGNFRLLVPASHLWFPIHSVHSSD